MKTTREYIELLRSFKEREAGNYGISRLCLFGSVARGEQRDGSDVDVCIECPPLGCHVDLIRFRDRMNLMLREQIEREGIYV